MLKCVHSETNFDLRAPAMTASTSAAGVSFFAEAELSSAAHVGIQVALLCGRRSG